MAVIKIPFFNYFELRKIFYPVEERCACCKRSVARPHCPGCGSVQVFALAPHATGSLAGNIVETTMFRCRRCRGAFSAITALTKCEAPTLTEIARKKNSDEALEKAVKALRADGASRKELLEALFKLGAGARARAEERRKS